MNYIKDVIQRREKIKDINKRYDVKNIIKKDEIHKGKRKR